LSQVTLTYEYANLHVTMVTQKSCEPKVEIVQYSQGIRTHTEVSDSALHFAIFPGGPGVWLQANCNVLQKQLVPPIWNPE